ncbi:helix-turn-helix domain-containing protein [Arthrobacter pigmenti]
MSAEDFTAELARHLQKRPQPESAALTRDQEDILSQHGGVAPVRDSDVGRQMVASTQANLAEQIRSSISVEETATLLQIDPSRVRRWLRDLALYGFKFGAATRIPRWQFTSQGTPLPRLRAVLQALPNDLHPLEVAGFMTTADPDLTVRNEQVSPREWLEAGGNVEPILELVDAIDTW